MNTNLYIVDYPRKTDFAEGGHVKVEYDYSRFVTCPECGSRVSGVRWKQPREVVLTKRKAPDFLYVYSGSSPFVISHNALEKIQNAGLTGITCAEEVETVRFQRKAKTEIPIPRYYYIDLARSCITINHEKSKIVYQPSKGRKICRLCQQVPAMYNFFRKLCLNTDNYEGYDIFQIYELGDAVFLSQRFVDFCNENNLTNLHFSPAQVYGQWMASYFLDGNEDA